MDYLQLQVFSCIAFYPTFLFISLQDSVALPKPSTTIKIIQKLDRECCREAALPALYTFLALIFVYKHIKKHSIGAQFTHPISGCPITDHAVRFVDDMMQFINPSGICMDQDLSSQQDLATSLFTSAQKNITTWNDIIWFSGGKLNPPKCYYFSFIPKYDFKKKKNDVQQFPSNTSTTPY
jgi:hypothetical protein